jgi:hypothetical protein
MDQLQTRLEAVEQRSHTVARPLCWTQSLGDPMTRVAAGLLAVAVFLAGLLWAAPASAVDPRIPLSAEPFVLPERNDDSGYCEGFAVEITFPEFNQYIIQQTVEPDGTRTLHITGHAQATATNPETGESVTYNISGPGTVVIYPDGAFSLDLAGPNLLYTEAKNLEDFPDVPTISYTTGHVTVKVNASGQTTEYELAGGARQTDVCAVLAP